MIECLKYVWLLLYIGQLMYIWFHDIRLERKDHSPFFQYNNLRRRKVIEDDYVIEKKRKSSNELIEFRTRNICDQLDNVQTICLLKKERYTWTWIAIIWQKYWTITFIFNYESNQVMFSLSSQMKSKKKGRERSNSVQQILFINLWCFFFLAMAKRQINCEEIELIVRWILKVKSFDWNSLI